MDRAVNREAGGIDAVLRVITIFPFRSIFTRLEAVILIKHHPIRINQKMMVRPGHARREVSEDQIVPTVIRHQSIRRSQIYARLPFLPAKRDPEAS